MLTQCLQQWDVIHVERGSRNHLSRTWIPRGPVSSGMLSEVVLQHIDKAGEKGARTRYFRYVDDIKIFAKSEGELKEANCARSFLEEIGLFPQTAKINIRRISDPSDEIKSVSQPPEPSLRPFLNQKRLASRLLELTRRSQVDPLLSTRFKYLLAQAKPHHRLSDRLLSVLRRHPEYGGIISAYFSRYASIPTGLAAKIVEYIREPELYHSVAGVSYAAVFAKCLQRRQLNWGDLLRIGSRAPGADFSLCNRLIKRRLSRGRFGLTKSHSKSWKHSETLKTIGGSENVSCGSLLLRSSDLRIINIL